ncbi:protein argonaute 7-like, partial [Phalaenopsis equestris]|uniref:protein argonaute 7-like n=1 Tax=Phalaenopsis equestris TaxID=78828 RepID=UPI0009E493BA
FLVKFDPMQKIFHYDVEISPRPSKEVARMIKRKLILENSEVFAGAHPVFDGRKNLYSSIGFQDDRIELFVNLPITTPQSFSNARLNSKLFKVIIRLVSKVSGEELRKFLKDEEEDGVPLPQDYLHALDVVLRKSPMENFISVGRSFFSTSMGGVEDIGGGALGL